MSEDITFCANHNCNDMDCMRNPKHIKLPIWHSFSLFPKCPKWSNKGSERLTEQINDSQINTRKDLTDSRINHTKED